MILLSSQTKNLIGISQGFIKSISNDGSKFSLLLDKDLAQCNEKSHFLKDFFRIDKINFRSQITLNYTNLARLMSVDSSRLRKLIIEKIKPTFEPTLPKNYVLKNKSILKKLNSNQQAAVIKVNTLKKLI